MKSETLKKIHYISGSKHEHRFSDPFFDLVQNTSLLRFWYLLRLCNFCKARGTCETKPNQTKVPAKYASLWIPNQKRPEDSRVLRVRRYGSRPLISSTPGSSNPERPGLDNTTSEPWSDATWPCTTASSAQVFVTLFLFKKTRQSTKSGCTGASCGRPWLTHHIVSTGSFQRG